MIKKAFSTIFILAAISFAATPLSFEVIGTLPHNPQSFTQGLIIVGDHIYKSTGSVGRGSKVIQIDKRTGQELRFVAVPEIFGEGLAFDGSMLWQLSWKEQRAFVWTLGLERVAEFSYVGEGWGLTFLSRRRLFAMTNGSSQVIFRDQNFNETHRITATLNGAPVDKLNELEYWNGRIWANRWYSDTIFGINPESGIIEHFIDLTELRRRENPSIRDGNVLNGIAEIDSNTLLISGKRWRNFYIISARAK
ncbi:MAG: glutaminyl-peptide cyclotransferase [Chitinivibrionia bacterium]|nr:glutaminyl-peptide cyclotransferase [Chitinivibrionia bacterium]